MTGPAPSAPRFHSLRYGQQERQRTKAAVVFQGRCKGQHPVAGKVVELTESLQGLVRRETVKLE